MTPIVDKITKLLALAQGKGTTPAEAATAAAQANRLMFKHGIEQAQLDAPASEPIDSAVIHRMGKRCVNWRVTLANGIALLHTCRTLAGYGEIHVVGTPSNRQIVTYLYVYLAREIERLAREEKARHKNPVLDFASDVPLDTAPRGKGWYDSFRKGAVRTVLERLRADRRTHQHETRRTAAGSTALVRIDQHDQQVAAYAKTISGGPRQTSTGSSDHRAYARGKKAAKDISINTGISGRQVKRIKA